MKILLLLFSLFSLSASAQKAFNIIDAEMESADPPSLDSLASFINSHYTVQSEKARAAFSWIAHHVAYNMGNTKSLKSLLVDDTATWKDGDVMIAEKIFRRRTAVCDEYARLFTVLCSYCGLDARLVKGYARGIGASRFRTNHSWNAVCIDTVWQLIDVTWAAGFTTYANEFVPHFNDYYFCTPPKDFIADHFPEDLQWTLLPAPPGLHEFNAAPFKPSCFIKYAITSYRPAKGIIEAKLGDTILIELETKDRTHDSCMAANPFFDSTTFIRSPASAFLSPVIVGKKIFYQYTVQQAGVQWLHLLYNDDEIMQYRLLLRTP